MLPPQLRSRALSLLFVASAAMIGCESKLPKIQAEDAGPRPDGSGPPAAYVRYEAPPIQPPAEPPGPPEGPEFTELPVGWSVPGFSTFGYELDGVHVGLQYSGLYWRDETLAEFPDGAVPEQALDELLARLEAHGQRNPKRINLFVHPTTRFDSFYKVVKRVHEGEGEVRLVIRSSHGSLGIISLASGNPEFGRPAFLAHLTESTLELGVWRYQKPPEWTLTVDDHGRDRDGAIGQWRSEVLPIETFWLSPIVSAESNVSVQEVVHVYDALRGLHCPLRDCPFHELHLTDRRPSG